MTLRPGGGAAGLDKVMRFGDQGDVHLKVNRDLTLTNESLDKLRWHHQYVWDYIRHAPQILNKCKFQYGDTSGCNLTQTEQNIVDTFRHAVRQYSMGMRRIKQGLGGLGILGGAYALNRFRRKQGSSKGKRKRRSRRRRSRRR